MIYNKKQKFKYNQSEFYKNLILKKSKYDSFHIKDNIYNSDIHLNSFCFMFTVHFKPIKTKSINEKQNIIKKEIAIIHNNISDLVIQNKARRNQKFRPFVAAFYDVECSRTQKYNNIHELPHVHGVLLIHPKTMPEFEKILDIKNIFKSKTNYVDRICFQKIHNGREGIEKIIDYGLKYSSNVFDLNFNFELDYVFPETDVYYPFYGNLDQIQI